MYDDLEPDKQSVDGLPTDVQRELNEFDYYGLHLGRLLLEDIGRLDSKFESRLDFDADEGPAFYVDFNKAEFYASQLDDTLEYLEKVVEYLDGWFNSSADGGVLVAMNEIQRAVEGTIVPALRARDMPQRPGGHVDEPVVLSAVETAVDRMVRPASILDSPASRDDFDDEFVEALSLLADLLVGVAIAHTRW